MSEIQDIDWSSAAPEVPDVIAFPKKDVKKGRGRVGFEGEAIIWCSTCADFVRVDESAYNGVCPSCGNPMMMMRCSRCGHDWWLRSMNVLPSACPKCKSPYWCRTRVKQ